jgi:hypothetical protein
VPPHKVGNDPPVRPTAVRFKFVDMVHGIDSTWFQTFERV